MSSRPRLTTPHYCCPLVIGLQTFTTSRRVKIMYFRVVFGEWLSRIYHFRRLGSHIEFTKSAVLDRHLEVFLRDFFWGQNGTMKLNRRLSGGLLTAPDGRKAYLTNAQLRVVNLLIYQLDEEDQESVDFYPPPLPHGVELMDPPRTVPIEE